MAWEKISKRVCYKRRCGVCGCFFLVTNGNQFYCPECR